MRLFNIAGAADHGRYAGGLKQTAFGAVRNRPIRLVAGKCRCEFDDLIALQHVHAGRGVQQFELDGGVGFDALHLGQERGGVVFDFLKKLVLGGPGQRAGLEDEFAFLGHDVGGQAAANQTGLHRGEGHGEGVVARFQLLQPVGHLADVDDDAGGVFDRIDALRGVAGMGLTAGDAAAKAVRALVRNDGLHQSRFADNAAGDFQANVL